MKWQGKSVRRSTGGRIKHSTGKRKSEMGREPTLTHLGETRKKHVHGFGGNTKIRLLRSTYVNVTDPSTGKTNKTAIETVEANAANRNYVRRNIITKGAIIETAEGKAKVTNRPSQDGLINAILLEKKQE
ncbi:MAG: 30S ribosomal protein S8e [Euryarchaeota archaeon]|nr:30S ribosomal protein S8e [Euryarchaeota archaeon]